MYIEFRLPSGAGGMAAGYTKQAIMRLLTSTCEQMGIEHKRDYITVTKPYRLRVEFYNPQHLTMFTLKWVPKNEYFRFTIKQDDINSDIVSTAIKGF
jgi:hypothetical protein